MKTGLAAIFDGKWVINNALYVVQMFLSYSLMLVCMYFNVWLVFAVCFGMGVGRLMFGVIPNDGQVGLVGEENRGQTTEGCNC